MNPLLRNCRHPKSPLFHLLLSSFGAVLTLLVFDATSWDVAIESWFVDPDTHLFIYRDSPILETFFHKGLRDINAILAITTIAFLVKGLWQKPSAEFKIAALTCMASLATIPSTTSLLKKITHRSCPWSYDIFGGQVPFSSLLSVHSSAYPLKGGCFPAGHASGGFMWLGMALAFWWIKPLWARVALIYALIMGWTMGVAQMIRGAHFLSHTLFTVFLAWLIGALWWWFWQKMFQPRPAKRLINDWII